jgi:PAS domain S-box-containing protein
MKQQGIVDSGGALERGIGAMNEARVRDFFDKMVKAGLYKAGEVDLKKVATYEFVNRSVGKNLRNDDADPRRAGLDEPAAVGDRRVAGGGAGTSAGSLRRWRARAPSRERQERLASESRWNRLLESAGAGVWEWDVKTEQARYSSRWKAMLGYANDEIGGTAEEWLDRLHPEDARRARREFGALVSGRSPAYLTQYRLRCKDGSYKWIEDFGIAVSHDAEGRPDRVVGTHTDATRSRQAEELLRQSEALYRALFDSNPEALWVYDLETLQFLAVNQVALDRYGYTREEFLQLTMLDVRPPEDRPRIREWVTQVVAQAPGFISAGHWVHQRRSGETFKVDVLGKRILFDGRPAGLTMARDLTAQLQAERTLRESEDTLRAIFEQAGVGVALTDSHTLQLRRTNRKYNELLDIRRRHRPSTSALTHPRHRRRPDADGALKPGEIRVRAGQKAAAGATATSGRR